MSSLSLSTDSKITGRVVGPLKANYATVANTLRASDMVIKETTPSTSTPSTSTPGTSAPSMQQPPASSAKEHLQCILKCLENEPVEVLQEVVDEMYFQLALKKGIKTYPKGFAMLSTDAMMRLQDIGKENLVFKFTECIAKNRPGTEELLMPLTRMPFGLIEYQILFLLSLHLVLF